MKALLGRCIVQLALPAQLRKALRHHQRASFLQSLHIQSSLSRRNQRTDTGYQENTNRERRNRRCSADSFVPARPSIHS
jgi:hypothetical protein